MGVSYRSFGAATAVRTGAERATLVRRTYALVFGGVLLTMAGVAFGNAQPGIRLAVMQHPWIALLCVFAPLLLARSMYDRFPANIGLTLAFTFAEGVWLSPVLWFMEQRSPGITAQAALLTGSTFAVLTLYATLSRRDFSAWGGFLTIGLWVLIGTMLLNFFFKSALADLWLAGVGTLLFGGLLVFDTWRLRNVFGPNDYVLAAVQIYLDLLNLFLFILQLLTGGDRRR